MHLTPPSPNRLAWRRVRRAATVEAGSEPATPHATCPALVQLRVPRTRSGRGICGVAAAGVAQPLVGLLCCAPGCRAAVCLCLVVCVFQRALRLGDRGPRLHNCGSMGRERKHAEDERRKTTHTRASRFTAHTAGALDSAELPMQAHEQTALRVRCAGEHPRAECCVYESSDGVQCIWL